METKNISLTENELFVIGMFLETFGDRAEKEIAWSEEDYKSYLSILEYLKEKQYINQE